MIEYNWLGFGLDYIASKNGLDNVIETIHWRLNATDEDGITDEIYGVISLPNPNPDEFTQLQDVSREIMILWVEGILSQTVEENGVEKPSQLDIYKKTLEDRILNKKNIDNLISSINI